MEAGRRAFLQGRRKNAGAEPFRPPWALAEADFLERCSRCGDCAAACPTTLLRPGPGGFPIADFEHAACNFCGECRTACRTGALSPTALDAWQLTAIVGEACFAAHGIVCRTCGEHCEHAAIRFAPRLGGAALPRIDAEACTGCGECVAACPSRAIAMARPALPSQLAA